MHILTFTHSYINPSTHCTIVAIYMSLYDYKAESINTLPRSLIIWPSFKKSIRVSLVFQRKTNPVFEKLCTLLTPHPPLSEAKFRLQKSSPQGWRTTRGPQHPQNLVRNQPIQTDHPTKISVHPWNTHSIKNDNWKTVACNSYIWQYMFS